MTISLYTRGLQEKVAEFEKLTKELKDENIKLGEKVIELSKQLGIEKSNYDELFKFFNEKYPDDMQGFFKPE